ncbi:MAG: ribonuclease PH, partial [Candidatus Contubernalis sp.]|nr:ribonuclease PH [Candidatus Contubernalis sp.]
NHITRFPVKDFLAAVSVGIVEQQELLDLNFEEDSKAQVDMNLVMTGDGSLVEIQGTAEGEPFSQDLMLNLLILAQKGTSELIEYQKDLLGPVVSLIGGSKE